MPRSTASSGDTPHLASESQRTLLVFRVGDAWLGVDAHAVAEIAERGETTTLPRLPRHVPGLIFLRGNAVPLLDLAAFLGLDTESETGGSGNAEANDDDPRPSRVVVVESGGMRVGLLSSRVHGLDTPAAETLMPPDALGARLRPFCSAQCDHHLGLLAILDLSRLLDAARPGAARSESNLPEESSRA